MRIFARNIIYYFLCCVVIGAAVFALYGGYYGRAPGGPSEVEVPGRIPFGASGGMSDQTLKYALAPYAKAVEYFTNINMVYEEGTGYVAPGLLFTIGKNCSGINYMIAVYAMMTFMFLHRISARRKLLWVILWAPGAAAVGVAATALRIIGSLPFAGYRGFSTLHAGIGISFYLAGMIGCFAITEGGLNIYGKSKRIG